MTQIVLTQEASEFIWEVVDNCPGEVGGVGYCYETEDGQVVVYHAFLLDQEVSSGSVDFSKDAMGIALEKAYEEGKVNDLRFSWHSHGTIGVMWSQRDEEGIDEYLMGGTPWLLSMVFNRRREYLARLDINNVPLVGRCKANGLPVAFERDQAIMDRAAQEIALHVKELKPPVTPVKLGDKSPGTGVTLMDGSTRWPLSQYEATVLREMGLEIRQGTKNKEKAGVYMTAKYSGDDIVGDNGKRLGFGQRVPDHVVIGILYAEILGPDEIVKSVIGGEH